MEKNVMDYVDDVIAMYIREDLDYVIGLAKQGIRPEGLETIEEEIRFIEFNKLVDKPELVRDVAERALAEIENINRDVWRTYAEFKEALND